VNRTDRLYALVEELRAISPRPRSARWLADRFEVSSRTIERDLSALQLSGVPIWAEPGRTGGYCLDPAHTLAPLGFTPDEALAMTIALGMLATSPFQSAAKSALRKVVAVTDESSLQQTAGLATRVHLLDDGAAAGVAPDLAGILTTGRVLRIDYRDRNGTESTREIEPLGYVGNGGKWFLVAWCRLRQGIRAFRGDRIVTVVTTDERATPRSFAADELDIAYGTLRRVALEKDS